MILPMLCAQLYPTPSALMTYSFGKAGGFELLNYLAQINSSSKLQWLNDLGGSSLFPVGHLMSNCLCRVHGIPAKLFFSAYLDASNRAVTSSPTPFQNNASNPSIATWKTSPREHLFQ